MWNNNLQEIAWHITKFIQTHADSFRQKYQLDTLFNKYCNINSINTTYYINEPIGVGDTEFQANKNDKSIHCTLLISIDTCNESGEYTRFYLESPVLEIIYSRDIDGNLDFDSFELLPMFHSLNKRLEDVFDEFKCYK